MIVRTSLPALHVALVCLVSLQPGHSTAADATAEFVESRGCRIVGSERSIRRLREIAAHGSVTWDGECRNGLIHGPGSLRHQGSTRENDRTRHYAFYLNGTAKAGRRDGNWRRESFNMFEDSTQYWTSLTAIPYVDGVARDPLTPIRVRGKADFTPAFQALLDGVDRKLAAAQSRNASAASGNPLPAIVPPAPSPGKPAAKPAADAREAVTQSAKPTNSMASQPATTPPVAAVTIAAAPAAPGSSPTANRAAPLSAAPPAAADAEADVESRLPGNRLNPYGSTAMWLGQITPPVTQERKVIAQTRVCAVDSINNAAARDLPIAVAQSEALKIEGWAADPRAARIPEKAWIRLYGSSGGPGLLIDLPRNTDRPDVARTLGDPAYVKAGFRVELAPGRLPTGDYTVAIIQQLGEELAVCQTAGKLRIR